MLTKTFLARLDSLWSMANLAEKFSEIFHKAKKLTMNSPPSLPLPLLGVNHLGLPCPTQKFLASWVESSMVVLIPPPAGYCTGPLQFVQAGQITSTRVAKSGRIWLILEQWMCPAWSKIAMLAANAEWPIEEFSYEKPCKPYIFL